MRNSKPVEITAILITFTAVVATLLCNCEFGPRTDSRLHSAIGKALAREALDLAGNGGQLIVIARDTAAFRQPASDILMASFTREVRGAHAAIIATRLFQVDPLRPVQVPSGDFFELIRRAPAGSVIVSLMGPPLLTEEQLAQLGLVRPKIVALCSGNLADYIDLRSLFERQLLHAAVVSRRSSPDASLNPANLPRTFDELYMSVTASNLTSLPMLSDSSH